MKCLKWQKVTLQLTWMSFLQNYKVCFNQERLPRTYRNFCHKCLVRPKSKSSHWQGSQLISYKAKFSQRDNIGLLDLKYNKTYENFHHRSLVRPKSKCTNWKGSQSISYKANFSLKGTVHLIDVKFNITYQNKQRRIKVGPFLRTSMSLNDTHSSQQLTVWCFILIGPSDIMLVFTMTINHLYFS